MTINRLCIDLSHWNEVTDWQAIKAAGIVGVILKASQGTAYIDPTYVERRKAAAAAGIRVGAYHFLDGSDAKVQADHFVSTTQPDEGLLLAADFEDADCSIETLRAFLTEVWNIVGQRPIIYSGHLIKEKLGTRRDEELAQYRLWLAHYSETPTWPTATWPNWFLHQFTDGDSGPQPHTCPGVKGGVDGDNYAGTAEQLALEWTTLDIVQPSPPEPPSEPETSVIEINIRITVPPNASVVIGFPEG